MSEPVTASMAEVRKHLADVIDRTCRLREAAERYEDEWLNRLADQTEADGTEGSVPMEEMAALLRSVN
ncbi:MULTISPECIES: prevent-host-death family protein [Streptomyces]|uniref:prevent-host-death family protein n=1 Tax=Streptomyces TaxID=1883 RepID=UPI0033B34231